MVEPLVSLITSAYRSDQYLESYFQGICAQTIFERMEVILVLNDPSDQAGAIAEKYLIRYPEQITIIKVPRETIGASTNRGYRMARGRYLAYADVDDAREPSCYERMVTTLENSPESDFSYGDFVVVPANGGRKGKLVCTPEFDRNQFTRASYVCANHFFRHQLLDRCGYWDEQFRSGGDFEFQVRAAFNCTFKKTPGLPLFYYTQAANSGSASSTNLQPLERTVVELRYGIYDKTVSLKGFPYVNLARAYRLDQILIAGEWKDIGEMIPGYHKYLADRNPERLTFEKAYRFWKVSHPLFDFYRFCIKAIRKIIKLILLRTNKSIC